MDPINDGEQYSMYGMFANFNFGSFHKNNSWPEKALSGHLDACTISAGSALSKREDYKNILLFSFG